MGKDQKLIELLESERTNIIERLAQIEEEIEYLSHSRKPDVSQLRFVYALECEDGYYYIGQTSNIDRRLKEHMDGHGSWFTRLHKPIRLIERRRVGQKTVLETMGDENKLAGQYMKQYGIHKVRGGYLIQRDPIHFIDKANSFMPQ